MVKMSGGNGDFAIYDELEKITKGGFEDFSKITNYIEKITKWGI
jgi:hypothetical protein